MTIKLIRRWDDNKFYYGQDMNGNIHCKCKACDKQALYTHEFDVFNKTHITVSVCPYCKTSKKHYDNKKI